MPIHLPDGSQSYPEFSDLADRVTNGDGVLWQGDPYCELRVGIVSTQRGVVVGHRLEVWRWCEDGEMRRLGSWHPTEQYRIPMDLAKMRADQPGGSKIISEIDKHNDKMKAEADEKWVEAQTNVVERLAYKLAFGEQGNAKNQHAIPTNPLAKGDS